MTTTLARTLTRALMRLASALCAALALLSVAMGATYGRQVLTHTGIPLQVSADGAAEFKAGGVTVDWSTVTAVSGSDATYGDGTVVKVGARGLPYGTVLSRISASGKYGPLDTTASDGRETASRGGTYILNETVLEANVNPLVGLPTDHPAVLEGGRVYKDRIVAGGTHQVSWANLEAALPRLRYVTNDAGA